MTTSLQGAIAAIKAVIERIGPATARQIETHPEVVTACRSSKAKARRLIERLHAQGHIRSTGDAQQPKYWVEDEKTGEVENFDFDKDHNKHQNLFKTLGGSGVEPLFTLHELAKEFGVTRSYLYNALASDPHAPQKRKVGFLSRRNVNYYPGGEIRKWWSERIPPLRGRPPKDNA